jgi:putative salt-induced outer membrane protein
MRFASSAVRLALLAAVASPVAAQDAPAVVTKVTADFGYVTTSGNTQLTTLSVAEKATQSRGRLSFEQTFNLVYGEQAGAVNTNFLKAGLRADYKLDELFALFVGAAFDRNRFAGITRRYEEQLGLQLRALAAPQDTIRLEGGASVTQQTNLDGSSQNFPAARLAGTWRHNFTPASYFQQSVEGLPNLKNNEDWRVNSESALVAPISARVGVKLSYVIRYDNLPEPTFKNTDRLFTTGIQITF